MSSNARMAMVLVLLLGPLSLLMKLWGPNQYGPVPTQVQIPAALTDFLSQYNLTFFSNLHTINAQAYQMALYHDASEDATCLAMIYVMPMPINAEAEFILARPVGVASVDFFYVHRGNVTNRYPSTSHWYAGVINRVRLLAGLSPVSNIVYGIASTSPCVTPRDFDWSQLSF